MVAKPYTLQQVEEMLDNLKQMPEVDKSKRRVSKQEAVNLLSVEIFSMEKRGYTTAEIVDVLNGMGLEIQAPTLRSYLRKLKKTKNVAPRTPPVRSQVTIRDMPGKARGGFPIREDSDDL